MKKFKFYIAAAFALALFSCDNYLDINSPNPNNISAGSLTPDKQLQAALTQTYRTQARTLSRLGNFFMQNWYGDVSNYTGVAFNDEFTYNLNPNFNLDPWDGLYLGVYNFSVIADYDSDVYDNHKAAALIMKSFYMQYIVDLYGKAPYSEAFLGSGNLNPKYDEGADIYRNLVQNIDDALVLLENADGSDLPLGTSDVVFGGDTSKWVALANTVKLKLLMRESAPGVVDPTYFADKIAEVDALNVFIDADVTINPGYNATTDNSTNPFYNIFFKSDGSVQQYNNYAVASKYAGDFLNGDNSFYGDIPAVTDPRAGALYQLEGGVVVGIEQGAVDYAGTPSFVNPVMPDATSDGLIMSLAEAKFLLAEAYDKGILTGDAKAAYTEGVQASFDQLGAGDATGYLFAFETSNYGWTGATNHTEAIMVQKWIATNSFNSTDSYIDLTRTGYPVLPLPTTILPSFSNRPYRLFYPLSEFNGNSANVPSFTQAELFVTGPFWKL